MDSEIRTILPVIDQGFNTGRESIEEKPSPSPMDSARMDPVDSESEEVPSERMEQEALSPEAGALGGL